MKTFSTILLTLACVVLTSTTVMGQTTVGPNNAGTGANVASVGTVAWTNPGNALTNNNSYATVTLASQTSNYLQTTNYGFAIPTDATINGIQATIGRFENTTGTGNDVRDNVVQLIKAGALVGSNYAVTGTDWPTSETAVNYGGTADLWGATWTPAEVNATNFGVALSANSTNSRTASVDYMTISVTYTPAPQTYTWNGGASASWATAASWSPSRTMPATTDILQFNGGGSVTATSVPTQTIGRLVISGNITLTLQSAASVTLTIGGGTGDDLVVESGSSLAQGTTVNLTLGSSTTANIAGTLTINSGCTYNTDGTSVVTTVTGTVVNSGTLTNATASKLLLQNGSTFQHNINNFTWPTATWDPGATFAITGLGTNSQSNPYPSFPTGVKNLIWDCPNQNFSNAIAHSGTLTVDNLTIRNTGTNATTGQFRVQTSPITVNNDLNISGGVLWIAGLGTKTLNVGRDLNMSGGELDVCTGTTASYTGIVNITRNLSLSNNAILDLSDSTSVALGTVNLQGNFTQSGTSVLRTSTTGTGSGVFNFSGTSAQTFSKSGGTIACATSGDSLSFIIDNNAIVDFGTSVLDNVAGSGSVRFTIAAGATMTIGSPDGISSSGATGTIQVTGTRRYNSGANYIYKNLTPTAQVTGNALPTSVNNLTVNNSAGVTLTADETISGTLTLTSGNVTTGASSLIIGSSGTVSRTSGHIIGNLRKNVATGATTRTFEVGTASGYNPVSVTFGSVSAAGNLTAKANAGDHVSLGSSTLDVAKSVNANWTLTKDGSLTFNNYTVVFNFNNPADLDGSVNTSSLIVGKYNAPTWTYPTVGTRTATSTQATGITSFSDFALAELAAAGPPAAPTALAATNVAQTQFQANWNSVSGATGYRLDVSTATDFSSYVSGYQDKPVAGTDDVVTGLTANTAYHYRVRAENGAGTSGNSGTIDVTTLVNVPAAPTALPATNIAQTQFQANWNSVSGATGYRLDVSAASTFSTYVSGYQNKAVDGTNDIVTGLTAGTAYHYRVRAENAGGASGNSDTIDVTTLAIVPGAPVATAATSVTQTSFQANWNASSGATSYRLDVATDVGFTALLTGYNDLTVAGMSQSVTGLTAGTPYYYRVRAVNTGGTSENSNTITATTLGFKTWTGGTGTGKNWTTGSNWSGGTAPLAGEDILFNTAGTITFSTMPASVSYNSLTISQGSVTLIHTSSITLTLGGNVSTDFTVASGASLLLGTNVSVTLATSATANIGGTLTVNASRTYNTDGTSVVTTVTGSIVNSGTVTCTSGSKLLFQGGSVYEHAQNDGTVPTATWNATSTCLVTGIVATYPTFADNQTLGNLTWNCTGQTAVGPITNNPPPAIAGNLTVQSTNTGSLRFQYGPVNITGNLVITDGVLWVAGSNGKDFVVGGNVTMSGDSLQLSGGSTRGTVSVAGNFSHTAGVIAATGTGGSNELIFNGSGDQTLTSTGGTVTSRVNFTINKSTGAVVLGSNMTFPDTLRLTSGNINTSSYILTIADSSNHVVRTSGHVVGNLSKRVATGATTRTFEVGTASRYNPVSVTFGSVSAAGYLTVRANASDHGSIGSSTLDAAKSVNVNWSLTKDGSLAFNNYSIVFNFNNPADLDGGTNTSNFIVGKYNDPSWTYPTVGTKTTTSTQATGLTSFSDFAIAQLNVTPTITVISTMTGFTSVAGTPSTQQSYTVAGANLTGNITITPPTDFELSLTSGSGFDTSPLTLTPSGGTVSTTTIYVRMNRTLAGAVGGNITQTSTGATQQEVAVSGTVTVGPASLGTSTITAVPTSIAANGSSTSGISVRLKDAFGNDLTSSGGTVALSTTLGTLGSVVDSGNGGYYAILTAGLTLGTATITGTLGGLPIIDDATVQFTANTIVAVSPVLDTAQVPTPYSTNFTVANVTNLKASSVRFYFTNALLQYDSVKAGSFLPDPLLLAALRAGATNDSLTIDISSLTGSSSGSGTLFTVYFTPLAGGTTPLLIDSVRLRDPLNVPIPGNSLSGTVLVIGPASGSTSLITANPVSITANGSSTSVITVQLKDTAGRNRILGGDIVGLLASSGTLSSVTDSGNGCYGAVLTSSTVAGVSTITGTVNAASITDDAAVTFTAGAANKVVFIQQPTTATTGAAISPAVSVQVQDALGNNIATSGVSIDIALTTGTGVLGGTTPQLTDVNGLATFNNLAVNVAGVKTLTASSGGLTPAVSNAFTITPVIAKVKVVLQGPYRSTPNMMIDSLNRAGHLASHFGAIPIPGLAVDSISIEVRDALVGASATKRQSRPAWLLTDGTIRGFADTTKNFIELDSLVLGQYYIVVQHRSHLGIISPATTLMNASSSIYDFTTTHAKAYSSDYANLPAMVLVDATPDSVFGMWAGNAANNNGLINAVDRSTVKANLGGAFYNIGDVNMDKVANALDRSLVKTNLGKSTQTP